MHSGQPQCWASSVSVRVEVDRKLRCLSETLEPMPVGATDFRVRMAGVLAAMGVDLRARVCDDRDDEDRWPKVSTRLHDPLSARCLAMSG